MEKLVYILSAEDAAGGDALRELLRGKIAEALRAGGASRISVDVSDGDVAAGQAIANHAPPVRAMVSFWLECADERGACEASLQSAAPHAAGYLVAEARPMIHEPPVGARTEGFNLVTCITRKPGLDDAEFYERWTVEHRRVAEETQSTFSYVRNAVQRRLTANAPPIDGIVEEGFPIGALDDPRVWYACADHPDGDAELKRRLQRMMGSVTAFLDLSVIDSTPMSEYFLG